MNPVLRIIINRKNQRKHKVKIICEAFDLNVRIVSAIKIQTKFFKKTNPVKLKLMIYKIGN